MLSKEDCKLLADSKKPDFNVCSRLYVVDGAKTDMEYDCLNCYDGQIEQNML